MGTQCIEKYLATTEVYRGGQWITVEPLPVAVMGVRGATVDNTVYMTGRQEVLFDIVVSTTNLT